MNGKGDSGASREQSYSEEFVASVVCKFEIPQEKIEKLRAVLNKAAWMYRLSRSAPANWTEQFVAIRKALEPVEVAYLEFADALANLSDLARDRLWHPLFEDRNFPPDFHLVAEPFKQDDYPDEKEFRTVLDAFAKRIRARLGPLEKFENPIGRPKLLALRVWVEQFARFFREELGWKFTYSENFRQPKSRAYNLCWYVLQPLDPKVTPQQLTTGMRYAVIR